MCLYYFIPYSHCKYDDSAYESFQLAQVYDISTIRNISDNFLSMISNPKIDDTGNVFFIKNTNAVYASLYKELVNSRVIKDTWI